MHSVSQSERLGGSAQTFPGLTRKFVGLISMFVGLTRKFVGLIWVRFAGTFVCLHAKEWACKHIMTSFEKYHDIFGNMS